MDETGKFQIATALINTSDWVLPNRNGTITVNYPGGTGFSKMRNIVDITLTWEFTVAKIFPEPVAPYTSTLTRSLDSVYFVPFDS